MPKETLFPHVPGKKEPLFPHAPKGKETGTKTIDVRGMALPEIDRIDRKYPAALYRQIGISYSHDTTEQDIREFRERAIREGAVVIVIQEYGQYAYIPLEKAEERLPQTGTCYQDAWRFIIKEGEGYLVHGTVFSGDRRIGHAWVETSTGWIWEPETGRFFTSLGFKATFAPIIESAYSAEEAAIMAARTKNFGPWTKQERSQYLGEAIDLSPQSLKLLASTEGNPIRKFCCRLCGECAPKELLEEGRFLDRISWLRSHYQAKHPGMWGKMSPMAVEDGEPVSPEYRHLVSLVREPLPREAY